MDWGLHYTCTKNLLTVERWINDRWSNGTQFNKVFQAIGSIPSAIFEATKTLRWKLRSLVGPRVRWYFEVD